VKVRLPAGEVRRPPTPAHAPREAIRCPNCGSPRVEPFLAFIDGARFFCKDCGFRGPLVVTGFAPPERKEGEGA
jgi:hypothetical protein